MNTISLTIPFAAEAGDGESRWIRLEQVEIPDEGATLEQAADLIDALYGIDPCEDGLGSGGEESDEEELPEEADFLDMAKDRLGMDLCDEGESATWDAEVDVLRSHQDDAYNLQGERVEVGETTPMSKLVTETVELDGATYDLQWPCGGEVGVSAGEVESVKGSTVNFAAPVMGRIRISYRAVWDRVKLKVRRGAAANAGDGVSLAGVLAVSGGAAKTSNREEDAASVVAFWRDLAAECSLTRPPEDDQDIDRAEIERLCNRDTDWHVKGECWQTIERYNLCNCSGREAPDAPEPEDVDAPCPDGVRPGSWLGVVRRLEGYVDCEGEDDEGLNTAEFFKEHCCEDRQYSPLPRCRETREPHKGGKEIEHGPERWKELYGESVRLTAVTPEGGNCGELVRVWAVPKEIEGPPVLPDELFVEPGSNFSVTVTFGGRPPFTWIPPEGVEQVGTAAYGFMGLFRADPAFRGGPLSVVDACGRSAMCALISENCYWDFVTEDYLHSIGLAYCCEHLSPNDLPDIPYGFNADMYCKHFAGTRLRLNVHSEYYGSSIYMRTESCEQYGGPYTAQNPRVLFSATGKYAMFCQLSYCAQDDVAREYYKWRYDRDAMDEICADRENEYGWDDEVTNDRSWVHVLDARDVLAGDAMDILAYGRKNPDPEGYGNRNGPVFEAILGLMIHEIFEYVCE